MAGLSLLLFSSPLYAQPQKPEAIVAPVSGIGNISEGEKGIIFNTLQSELSGLYQLVPQDDYEKAEERAFQEIEKEKCTADQCIRLIQEYLQVERFFVLQIIREGGLAQLSLTLMREDDKLVKLQTCEHCSIAGLNAKVSGLVSAMVTADREAPQPPPVVRAKPEAPKPPVPENPIDQVPPKPEVGGKATWALITGGLLLLGAGTQFTDADDTQDEATALAQTAQQQNDPNLFTQARTMQADAVSQAETAVGLGIIGAGLVIFYLASGDGEETARKKGASSNSVIPLLVRLPSGGISTGFTMRW